MAGTKVLVLLHNEGNTRMGHKRHKVTILEVDDLKMTWDITWLIANDYEQYGLKLRKTKSNGCIYTSNGMRDAEDVIRDQLNKNLDVVKVVYIF